MGRKKEPMASKVVETFFENGKWRNRLKTAHVFSKEYDTREEAAAAGQKLAHAAGVEHVVRDLEGTLAEREPEDHAPDLGPE
jgi:hypothetical protein